MNICLEKSKDSEKKERIYKNISGIYRRPFIAISGTIGAGKTTLTKSLASIYGFEPIFEPVNDEHLGRYYKDMARWSFSFQVHLLNKRFKLQKYIMESQKTGIIQDRFFGEDQVFVRTLIKLGSIDKMDVEIYDELYDNMRLCAAAWPSIVVFLDTKPEIAYERMKIRNREQEKEVPLDYFKLLHDSYEDWLSDIAPMTSVLRIDWNTFKSASEVKRIVDEHAHKYNLKELCFNNYIP